MTQAHVFQHQYSGVQIFVYHCDDKFNAKLKIFEIVENHQDWIYIGIKQVLNWIMTKMTNFQLYIIDVKQQLYCNASDEYKKEYITYNYTNEQVDNNLMYFEKCMRDGLSPYKALLYFGDYLNEIK